MLLVLYAVLGAVEATNITCNSWYSYNATGNYSECVACPDGSLALEAGSRCIECGQDVPMIPFNAIVSNTTCTCLEGFVTITNVSGQDLPSVLCYEAASCEQGRTLASDSTGALRCACKPGYEEVNDACVLPDFATLPTSSVQLSSSMNVESSLITDGIKDAIAACASQGDCLQLRVWCALQQHDPSQSACSALGWLSLSEPLWEYPLYPFKVALNPANTLLLYIMKWEAATGRYLGVFSVTTELAICDTPLSTVLHMLKSGTQGSASCAMDPSASADNTTYVYRLFMRGDGKDLLSSLVPLPVQVRGTLHEYFYTIDRVTAAGWVRYVSKFQFRVHVGTDGTITRPVFEVEYAAVPAGGRAQKVIIGSEWVGASGETSKALIGVCVVLSVMGLAAGLLRCLAYSRRRQEAPLTGSLLVRGATEASGEYSLGAESSLGFPSWARHDGFTLQATEDGRWVVVGPKGPVLFSAPHNGAHPTRCAPWFGPDNAPKQVIVTNPGMLSLLVDYNMLYATVASICNTTSNLLLLVMWLGCSAYYIEYKHSTSQTNVTRAMPTKLGPFYGVLTALLVAKVVATVHLYYRQCKVSVVFVDWEVSRSVDKSTNKELPVSMWRRTLVANEFHKLACSRTWRTHWCLIWCIWLYLGLGYDSLTAADPDITHRHKANWGVPQGTYDSTSQVHSHTYQNATHPILRVAVTGFFLFFASLIWMVLHVLYHQFLPENPLSRFEDVLAQCNVSILLLPLPRWGYYMHGHKQLPVEGSDTAELSLVQWQIQQNEVSLQPAYVPVKRKFEIFLSKKQAADIQAAQPVRQAKTLRRERATFRRCFERIHGVTVMGGAMGPPSAEQEEREKVLRENLDRAVSGCVVKFTLNISSWLGLPPLYPLQPMNFAQAHAQAVAQVPLTENPIQLYAEPMINLGPGWASATTLLGADD
eukprot:TRINITY_DN838_c2_g2_i1.p1 TRINITY_DN838_c2_g2~~TRINITY_DN838_c2_g2_i1.p1  ORF type:complete len:932 (+),score=199.91 TRINITY_DN838_c2_g2_i1:1354-4149(+)